MKLFVLKTTILAGFTNLFVVKNISFVRTRTRKNCSDLVVCVDSL
jgi:hypothetical protein